MSTEILTVPPEVDLHKAMKTAPKAAVLSKPKTMPLLTAPTYFCSVMWQVEQLSSHSGSDASTDDLLGFADQSF